MIKIIMNITPLDVKDEKIVKAIQRLIKLYRKTPDSYAADLTVQMVQTCLKLMEDHDIAQMKLVSRALREMRHAYNIFRQYSHAPCVSIFGSARTPENHPDYITAKEFGSIMAVEGWMSITGAADGIMKAGLEGAQRESSFGLSIRLPWEDSTTSFLSGDDKLMIFRYFFTRKLMFLTHADAIAAFPGGFGTMDELFEVLTLLQTGKTNLVPLVLLEGKGGNYWKSWQRYIRRNLKKTGWMSASDENLYYIASSPADAKKHILHFYKNYHSSRYVKDVLVIRLKKVISPQAIRKLNRRYSRLISSGFMALSFALPEETDFLDLPRLIFHHTRKDFSILRALIDDINNL